MNLFDVYSVFDIELVKAQGCNLFDSKGNKYLDLYGGHAVISIGHSHQHYIKTIEQQLEQIGFFSNVVKSSKQEELAEKMGILSGYSNYSLFLCNSGTEANENAIKLASFETKKKKVLAFKGAFHGRTSGSVAVTDIPQYSAPFNITNNVTFVPLNNIERVKEELSSGEYCAVIIEGIQGVSGIHEADIQFLKALSDECSSNEVILILDEIQSGCGRTGKYFYHQYADIKPDMITLAKGIGNGFPIAALFISPKFKAVKGSLGTTYGGNYLACAAGIAVADIMKNENLISNAEVVGNFLISELKQIAGIKEIRGKGLMIGIEMFENVSEIRKKLLFDYKIFTGSSSTDIIRLLPPLCLTKNEAEYFIDSFKSV